jgi:hypothetical protein
MKISNFKFQINNEKIYKILLVIIFTISFFLRFYQVPERFFFGIDEEYSSLLALSIIKDFHIIWIGLSAANTGFYVGPGVIYIHSLLLWLSHLDPIILAYTASIVSIIFLFIFYFIVKGLFNKRIAIISTTVYSLSSFVVSYDRRFWNSTFVPITVILFYLSLVKSAKNPLWYISTAILLGISFHINASLFVFIPIIVTVIIWRIIHKPISTNFNTSPSRSVNQFQSISTYFISFVSFLLIYSPLIVYDFVHNFDNLKTPFRILHNIGKNSQDNFFISHLQTILNTINNFLMIPNPWIIIKFIVLIILFSLFINFYITNSLKGKHPILTIIVFYYLVMFLFYPGKILDYYFLGFLPFLSIIIAYYLKKLTSTILIILGIIYITISINNFLKSPFDNGLAYKKELIKKTIKVISNNSFYLDTYQVYLYFGGWRYLFEAYGKKPVSSQADSMFGWIYQKEISSEIPNLKVIISDNNIRPSSVQSNFKKITIGQYNSYIISNE